MSMSGAVVNPQLVPSYIQRLGKEKVMHGKTFSTLQMQQPKKDGDRARAALCRIQSALDCHRRGKEMNMQAQLDKIVAKD